MDNERGFWKKSIDPGSPYCSPLLFAYSFSPLSVYRWLIGYASHVHKGLPSCTDNHRVERSHRLQTVEDDGVHVRDDLREHRKLVEREIEARWNDTGVIDVSILEDVTLRWVTNLLTTILRLFFF